MIDHHWMTGSRAALLITLMLVSHLWSREPKMALAALVVGLCVAPVRYLGSVFWGVLCAYVLYRFELGWTTFVTLLFAVALASIIAGTGFERLRTALIEIALLLLPPILVSAATVPGLEGKAVAGFLAVYGAFLAINVRKHSIAYAKAHEEHLRLQAMIEAAPGVLFWTDQKGMVTGSNQIFSQLDGASRSSLTEIARGVLDHSKSTWAQEAQLAESTYYLVAKRYQDSSGPLVVGFDISHYKETERELVRLRAKNHQGTS